MSHVLDHLRHIMGDDGGRLFKPRSTRVQRGARLLAAMLLENKAARDYLSPGEAETILDGAEHALNPSERKLLRQVGSFSELERAIPLLEPSLGSKLVAFADYHTVITAEGEERSTIEWKHELPDKDLSIIAIMYQMGRWPALSARSYDFANLRASIIQNAEHWCSAKAARKDWNLALLPLGLRALLSLPDAPEGRCLRASFLDCQRLSIPEQHRAESLSAYVKKLPQTRYVQARMGAWLSQFPDLSYALSTAVDGYGKGWERFTPFRIKNKKIVTASIIKAIDTSISGELKKHQRRQLGLYVSEDCWGLAATIRTAAAKAMREGTTWAQCVEVAIANLPESKRRGLNFEAACRLALKNGDLVSDPYDTTPASEFRAVTHATEQSPSSSLYDTSQQEVGEAGIAADPSPLALAAVRLHSGIEEMLEVISDGPVMSLNTLRTQLAGAPRPLSADAYKVLESYLENNARTDLLRVFRMVQRSLRSAPASIEIPPLAELLTRPVARQVAADRITDHLLEHAEHITSHLDDLIP